MVVVTRKRAKENQIIDRISDLPNSIIDSILDRVTIGDAVRTSVLSSKWRHHWTRVRNLVFDQKFVRDEIVRTDSNRISYEMAQGMKSHYFEAVGTFLWLYQGPIHKFVLHVPYFCEDRIEVCVNKWMPYLSQCGVKDITLDAHRTSFLPLDSNIFNCTELRHLALHNCKAVIPYNFRGFDKLISLHLSKFRRSCDEVNILISKCPQLENFCIESYRGPLSVSGLKLKTLRAYRCSFEQFTIQSLPSLISISFRNSGNDAMQPHEIVNFFGLMPKIESITFDRRILRYLAEQHVPKTLPTSLECLKNLTLLDITTSEPNQMSCALCILRSSPHLQTFSLDIFRVRRCPPVEEVELADVAFLEEQLSEPIYLRNLLTVKMKGLLGFRSHVMLLKFILTSCPALEMLYANAAEIIGKDAELMMMSELMECTRVSSKAKISYSKGEGRDAVSYSNVQVDSSIFDF
ncbi:unnamed protein product [Rhodiola kirilowii]